MYLRLGQEFITEHALYAKAYRAFKRVSKDGEWIENPLQAYRTLHRLLGKQLVPDRAKHLEIVFSALHYVIMDMPMKSGSLAPFGSYVHTWPACVYWYLTSVRDAENHRRLMSVRNTTTKKKNKKKVKSIAKLHRLLRPTRQG